MRRVAAALLATVVVAVVPVHAQNVDIDERIKSISTLGKSDPEYRLGAGDLIEIGVFGVDGFRHTIRISASGIVKLPLIDPIMVAGLTPAELEQRLTTMLGDDVINDPQVSVFVKEYRSQSVYVLGAVNASRAIEYREGMTVMEAILEAGGFTRFADQNDIVIRRKDDDKDITIEVKAKKLLKNGDLTQNVLLKAGDYIVVSESLF